MKFKMLLEYVLMRVINSQEDNPSKGFSALYLPKNNTLIKFNGQHHSRFFEQIKEDPTKLNNWKEISKAFKAYGSIDNIIRTAKTFLYSHEFFVSMDWITVYSDGIENLAFDMKSEDNFEDVIKLFIYFDREMVIHRAIVNIDRKYIDIDIRAGEKFPTTATQLSELFKNAYTV